MSDEKLSLIRNCYSQAQQCMTSNKAVRHLLNALSSHGCQFDFERHLSCEINPRNHQTIRGGFDQSTCQIVLFPENLQSSQELCTILRHELIHAFDYCRNKINFNHLDHLVCTEIRATSLSGECSLSEHFSHSTRPFLLKNQHSTCVQRRVRESIMAIDFNIQLKEINQSIERVFIRCYSDTNPFDEIGGRRGQQ